MGDASPRGFSLAGYAMVAGAAASWGLWPLFLRRAEARGAIPPELESTVALVMLTVVGGVTMLRDRSPAKASARAWAGVVWLGITDALNVVLFFRAIQLTTVAVAVLTHYLAPILVALGAPLVLGEKVTKRTFVAVFVSLTGLVLLLDPLHVASASPKLILGAASGAASALFYASSVLTNKRLAPVFSGSELAFYHGLVAVPLVAALVPASAWMSVAREAWPWLMGGAVGPGAVAGLVFVWGLRRVPAAHASALTLLEPLVAVLVGVLVFGEVPTPIGGVGALMVLAGAAIVVSSRKAGTAASSG
ncbi:MAG: DMT family transporter [Myxococcales bacterium]|nr:DMT family transporter [Myxococcales bacterium]